jgi:BirA family transcriptional regulator, biotin operon repressor / biotin---[acetyl-CoA-carboxylase] ligase
MEAPPRIPEPEAAVLGGSPLVRRWIWRPETDSTQREARDLARSEGPGLLILADAQTAGHGRDGRTWFSPRGAGLWMSMLLGSARPQEEWPGLTSLAALALRQALARAAGLPAGIKWPNDVFCRGRKIAGVLADVTGGPDGRPAIVLGVGLNIAQEEGDFPPELRGRATSVRIETGQIYPRAVLLEALLAALDCWWRRFEAGGAAVLHPHLREAAVLIGRRVTVRLVRGALIAGRVEEIGAVGELELVTDAGARETVAGGTVLSIDPPLDQGV